MSVPSALMTAENLAKRMSLSQRFKEEFPYLESKIIEKLSVALIEYYQIEVLPEDLLVAGKSVLDFPKSPWGQKLPLSNIEKDAFTNPHLNIVVDLDNDEPYGKKIPEAFYQFEEHTLYIKPLLKASVYATEFRNKTLYKIFELCIETAGDSLIYNTYFTDHFKTALLQIPQKTSHLSKSVKMDTSFRYGFLFKHNPISPSLYTLLLKKVEPIMPGITEALETSNEEADLTSNLVPLPIVPSSRTKLFLQPYLPLINYEIRYNNQYSKIEDLNTISNEKAIKLILLYEVAFRGKNGVKTIINTLGLDPGKFLFDSGEDLLQFSTKMKNVILTDALIELGANVHSISLKNAFETKNVNLIRLFVKAKRFTKRNIETLLLSNEGELMRALKNHAEIIELLRPFNIDGLFVESDVQKVMSLLTPPIKREGYIHNPIQFVKSIYLIRQLNEAGVNLNAPIMIEWLSNTINEFDLSYGFESYPYLRDGGMVLLRYFIKLNEYIDILTILFENTQITQKLLEQNLGARLVLIAFNMDSCVLMKQLITAGIHLNMPKLNIPAMIRHALNFGQDEILAIMLDSGTIPGFKKPKEPLNFEDNNWREIAWSRNNWDKMKLAHHLAFDFESDTVGKQYFHTGSVRINNKETREFLFPSILQYVTDYRDMQYSKSPICSINSNPFGIEHPSELSKTIVTSDATPRLNKGPVQMMIAWTSTVLGTFRSLTPAVPALPSQSSNNAEPVQSEGRVASSHSFSVSESLVVMQYVAHYFKQHAPSVFTLPWNKVRTTSLEDSQILKKLNEEIQNLCSARENQKTSTRLNRLVEIDSIQDKANAIDIELPKLRRDIDRLLKAKKITSKQISDIEYRTSKTKQTIHEISEHSHSLRHLETAADRVMRRHPSAGQASVIHYNLGNRQLTQEFVNTSREVDLVLNKNEPIDLMVSNCVPLIFTNHTSIRDITPRLVVSPLKVSVIRGVER